MAVTYLDLGPLRRSGADPDDGYQPQTLLGRGVPLTPLQQQLRREDAQYRADLGLTPDERLVRRAVERFSTNFDLAWQQYSRLQMHDALDGYYDFSQKTDQNYKNVLDSVSGPAKQMLQPVLSELNLKGLRLGLDHWDRQNQAVAHRMQLVQAEHQRADAASADLLANMLHEAEQWRDDPVRLQRIAERGEQEWRKLGERKGWDPSLTAEQLKAWNAQLVGVGIAKHLDNGDVPGARHLLNSVQHQLDPDKFLKLQAVTDAGEQYIANQRNTTMGGGDMILTAAPTGPANTNGEYQIAGGPVGQTPPATDDKPTANTPPLRDSQGNLAPGPDYILEKTPWIRFWVQQQQPVGTAAKAAAQGVKAGDPQIEQDTFVTPFPQAWGASLRKGWHTSGLGELIDQGGLPHSAIKDLSWEQAKQLVEALRQKGIHLPKAYDPRSSITQYYAVTPRNYRSMVEDLIERSLRDAGVKFYTIEEWANSEWYRDGLQFQKFMTPERAKERAKQVDDIARWSYLIQQRSQEGIEGFLGGAVGDVTEFVAGDPTVVVPIGAGAKLAYKGLRYGVPGAIELITSGGAVNAFRGAAVPAIKAAVKEGAIGSAISVVNGALQRVLHPGDRPWSDLRREIITDGLISAVTGGMGRLFRDAPGMGTVGSSAVTPKQPPGTTTPTGPNAAQSPAKAGGVGAASPTGQPAGPHSSGSSQPNAPSNALPGASHAPSAAPLPPLPGLNNPAAAWKRAIDPVHHADFADQMKPFQAAGLIKTDADVVKFAAVYKPDKILLPMPSASTKTPGQFVLQGKKTSMTVDTATNRRSFHVTETRSDLKKSEGYVVDAANAIERAYPGQIVCISCNVVNVVTGTSKEIDILMKNFAIEIKQGPASKLTKQVRLAEQWSGMPVIGYAPEAYSVVKGIRKAGGLATNQVDELLKMVKPPGSP